MSRATGPGTPESRRPGRRLLLVAPALLLVAAAALGGAISLGRIPNVLESFARPQHSGTNLNDAGTTLYTVTLQDLSSQTQAGGTLGYAGNYTVINQDQGTLTWLPSAGQVISQGQALYQVNGVPVLLLYGATPAYRSLSEGTTGADVTELNADLVSLGFVSSSNLSPTSDIFTGWTTYGVEKLQAIEGVDQTGTLTLGQVVFLPGAARVTGLQGTLGAPAGTGGPLLTASSTSRQVSLDLSADLQSDLAAGDQVAITLPNGRTTPGTVTSVGTVATSSQGASPTVPVLITPTDPAATGTFDAAPVDVAITTATVRSALVVPTGALLARPGGSYAVEVVSGGVHRLVAVNLGLFDGDGGLVQVTNTQLQAGQRVVVAP